MQNGQKERLCLARASAARNDSIGAGQDLLDRFLLVGIKPPRAKGCMVLSAVVYVRSSSQCCRVQSEPFTLLGESLVGQLVGSLEREIRSAPQKALLLNLLGQIPRSLLRLLQWCYSRWYERLST